MQGAGVAAVVRVDVVTELRDDDEDLVLAGDGLLDELAVDDGADRAAALLDLGLAAR